MDDNLLNNSTPPSNQGDDVNVDDILKQLSEIDEKPIETEVTTPKPEVNLPDKKTPLETSKPEIPVMPTNNPPVPPSDGDLPPTPELPQEKAELKKPSSKFVQGLKKNGAKIAGGVMMLTLLVGGAFYGVKEVQKRQVVEQEAIQCVTSGSRESQCSSYATAAKRGACENRWINPRGCQQPQFSPFCGADWNNNDKCQQNKAICELLMGGVMVKKTVWDNNPPGDNSPGRETEWACVPKNQVASPSPSPLPSPSPSPKPPTMACVDLSGETTDITIGDEVNFVCKGSFSSIKMPVASFRYSVDGGAYTESAAVSINSTTKSASYAITVDQAGDWSVQCRVCTGSGMRACTQWGQAAMTADDPNYVAPPR